MNNKLWQRKMSLGEVLSEGFRLTRVNLIPILLLVICVHAPLDLFRTVFFSITPVEEYDTAYVFLISSGIKWLDSFIGLITFIGIAYIVEKSLQGELVSLSNVFNYSFSKLGGVFWTIILSTIITFGLTLLLIIPGVIWSNYYSFSIIIAALRNMKGKMALEYSKKLIYRQWWRIFGINTAIFVSVLMINLPIFILAKKVSEIKFLYIFIPSTIFNIVGAIALVMGIVLFLNTEYTRDFQRQNRG